MKIIHIIPSVFDHASGPKESVISLLKESLNNNLDCTIWAMDCGPSKYELPNLIVFKTWSILKGKYPISFSFLFHSFKYFYNNRKINPSTIVHVHSVYLWPELFTGILSLIFNFQLVLSPHGTFSNYALNTGNRFKRFYVSKVFIKLYRNVRVVYAASTIESDDIKKIWPNVRIALIPWGMDHIDQSSLIEYKSNVILYLGRIHPHKGLDLVIESWVSLGTVLENWELHIVGSSVGVKDNQTTYLSELKSFVEESGVNNIHFFPPLYGEEKLEKFRRSRFSILMSHGENFGMTVIESMAVGTPVIVSNHTPWLELEELNCGFVSSMRREELMKKLLMAVGLSSAGYASMVDSCKGLVSDKYVWRNIHSEFYLSYDNIVNFS